MLRRRLAAGLVSILVVAGLSLVASPAGAATYSGPVYIGCSSAQVSGHITFTRDNTGYSQEALQVIVTDGNGFHLVNTTFRGAVGTTTWQFGLGTFPYAFRPTANPLTLTVTSLAGNGLTHLVELTAKANCHEPGRSLVYAVYRDFAGRQPTAAELHAETTSLAAGMSQAAFVQRMANSPAYVGVIVDRLYRDTLGRPADPGGRAYWVNEIRLGRRTVASVTASFYASQEYFDRLGASTERWVADMYSKLLRRSPDPGGIEYWAYFANRSRTSVALGFFQSEESRRVRVERIFRDLLGRAPFAEGLAYWVAAFNDVGEIELATSIASGFEYAQRAQVRFPPT